MNPETSDKEEKIKEQIDTLKDIRQMVDMNRAEFCRYMDIPLRTVEEWEAGRRKMPDYVLRLLAYYVKIEQDSKKGRITLFDDEQITKNREARITREVTESVAMSTRLGHIRNIMKKLSLSAEQAMDLLEIPESDRAALIDMI